jgi:hypothetical protein
MVEMFPVLRKKRVDSGRHGSLRGGPEVLRGMGDKGPSFRCGNNILVTVLGVSITKGGMCCISLAPARLAQLRSSVSWLFLLWQGVDALPRSSLQS